MRKIWSVVLFICIWAFPVLGDTQDTTVFRATMSPDNEVPPVSAQGVTGLATITVRVARDGAGNINAATVIFDIDYTVNSDVTFTGLHIHNAPAGSNGGVVINTGISASSSIAGSGSGHITRVVNYSSTDSDALRYVTGLLETPENYYVNIHTTTNPGGLMRAPLFRTSLTLRPAMSPAEETPAITGVDAEGAAVIQIAVNRNNSGAITSGTVTFAVDYRLPANSVITGLHIHNAAAGVAGPVVIDSGINGTTRSVTIPNSRGNIFRITDIDSNNSAGLATLTSLMNDPTQFYVNLHTTSHTSGILRGQLSKDAYAFFGLMTNLEENPPTATQGVSNTMTIVRVTRDGTGNIVSGSVGFNLAYSGFGGPVTFTGLHIHNANIGVNGGVVINTGISGANPVTDDDGIGSINREVTIDASGATALNAVKGLLANPEAYYVNIHSTTFPGGIVRSQLARETYRFKAAMSPANEIPAVVSNASATGWITVKVTRNATGAINGGDVAFDVDAVGTGSATTFTGLHIHSGSAAVSGGVVINSGISGTSPVESTTGSTNITRVVTLDPANAAQMAMLDTLINAPDQAYVNIHTTANAGGLARGQLSPFVSYVPQAAGGGEWITSIRITNSSTTSSVHGVVDAFQTSGAAMSAAIVDPNTSFLIPPGASTTVNLHNKGALTTGFARIYSSGAVTLSVAYNYPIFSLAATANPVLARQVSIPVVAESGSRRTGIAVLNLTAGQLVLMLRNSIGLPVPGGVRTIDLAAGQHLVGFVRDLLPEVAVADSGGTLTVESRPASGVGQLSAIGLQFNGVLTPVTVVPSP